MADKEKSKKEEEAQAAAVPEKASLLSKKNIVILSVLILVLGVAAFAGIKMMGKSEKTDTQKKESVSSHESKKETFIYVFKPLITNIAGTNASRFLKVTVCLQFENKELEKIFDEKNAIFLDVMNSVFSSLTLEQATEISQRESLKREIRDKVNEILAEAKKAKVKNVFFSEYICQ